MDSKRKIKKERVIKRSELLEIEIDNLLKSVIFEPFTEWKHLIESEIIKIIKKHNILSHYGKKWEVKTSLNPITNEFTFDVRANKGNWRIMKIIKTNFL